MTGVKAFIRDSMPKSWEQALLDHKCIDKFIEQFYQGIAEEKNKNKYHYGVTIIRARYFMRHKSISYIATSLNFKEGIAFWEEVNQTALNYELQWK